jgi:uncharacterized protein
MVIWKPSETQRGQHGHQDVSAIEARMLQLMNDGAHDKQLIYRVLYYVADIAGDYTVDMDVLLAAALLHDIGREAQFRNHKIDHAIYGADMAYEYLAQSGWSAEKAEHVRQCISTHRYRKEMKPESIEAKILFDADKLDVTGAIGIARTLAYKGIVAEPLYSVGTEGNVLDGTGDKEPSFFQEYNYKLKNVYDGFYTKRAKEIAMGRKEVAKIFTAVQDN